MSERLIGATFCSGIGTPELACSQVDWRLASEIEKFPRAVLQYRFGMADARSGTGAHHTLWSDLTTLRVRHFRRLGIPLPEVIVAGLPCQAFSVAGLRQSLSDDRGNLTLQFLRLLHAVRATGSLRNFVYENVPGLLNTPDNAFGCFLGGLVGADSSLLPPRGNKWPSSGMVSGPIGRAAWTVLDAQHFGLAQRRKRVFLVADFGTGADPVQVLFERVSLHGYTPASKEARKDAAEAVARSVALRGRDGGASAELGDGVSTAQRSAGGGGDKAHVLAPTIPSRRSAGGGLGTDFDLDGGQTAVFADTGQSAGRTVKPTLRAAGGDAGGGSEALAVEPVAASVGGNSSEIEVATTQSSHSGRMDFETETFVVGTEGQRVVHALRGEGFDASEDGTGRGTPLVPVLSEVSAPEIADTLSVGANQTTGFVGDDVACAAPIPFDTTQITSKANRSQPQEGDPVHPLAASAHAPAIAFSSKDYGADATEELSPTVRASGHTTSHANAGAPPPVALRGPATFNARQDPIHAEETSLPLDTDGGSVGQAYAERQWPASVAPTLNAHFGDKQGIENQHIDGGAGLFVPASGWKVRRLTPLECERLQGLPDNWTRIPMRKYDEPVITDLRPADMWEKIDGEWWLMSADGARYKAIGNGMARDVLEWILTRLVRFQPDAERLAA